MRAALPRWAASWLLPLVLLIVASLVAGCETDEFSSHPEIRIRLSADARLELQAQVGAQAVREVRVDNAGSVPLTVALSEPPEWLTVEPSQATLAPEEGTTLRFSANCPEEPTQGEAPMELTTNDPRLPRATLTVVLRCVAGSGVAGDSALSIAIEGLPEDQSARVNLTGPAGFERFVDQSRTFSDLPPGLYELEALDVSAPTRRWRPVLARQSITLEEGEEARLTVTYAAQEETGPDAGADAGNADTGGTGADDAGSSGDGGDGGDGGDAGEDATEQDAGNDVGQDAGEDAGPLPPGLGGMDVTLAGLPAGSAATVRALGPSGEQASRTGAGRLAGLVPGIWRVWGEPVQVGAATYETPEQSVEVLEGRDAGVLLRYAAQPGELQLVIDGLPQGLAGDVEVRGPAGFVRRLAASTVLDQLTPGSYTVTPFEVSQDGTAWAAAPVQVEVPSNQRASATVRYAARLGSLSVVVEGLGPAVDGRITVSRGAYAAALTSSASLDAIPVGTYLVEAEDVATAFVTWRPSVASQTTVVQQGQVTTVTVTYVPVAGQLDVTISGLPVGLRPSVRVQGLGAFDQQLNASQTLRDLTPGTYTVTALGVQDALGNTYAASGAQDVVVRSSQTAQASVTYADPTKVTTASDSGPGSLREVVANVRPGTRVHFAPNISSVSITSADIAITKFVTIEGPGPEQLALIAGNGKRHFRVEAAGELVLSGATLQGGRASEGGAVWIAGSAAISNCQMTQNSATVSGGAIFVGTTGQLTLENCTLSGNSAPNGGAMDSAGSTSLARVVLHTNSATYEGGALRASGALLVSDSEFRNNTAEDGAGFHAAQSTLTANLARSLFVNNRATGSGGAIFQNRPVVGHNLTLTQNTAQDGAGLMLFDGPSWWYYLTIVANTASASGGGVWNYGDAATTASFGMSLIAGNTLGTGATGASGRDVYSFQTTTPFQSLRFNLIGNSNGSTGFVDRVNQDRVGSELSPLNAGVASLADNGGPTRTMAILPLSVGWARIPSNSCQDGDGALQPDDQRGQSRLQKGFCDVGAYQETSRQLWRETFDTSPLSGSIYADSTRFVGTSGVEWTCANCRGETTYPIDGKGVILRSVDGAISSASTAGGVASLSVRMRKAFTSSDARRVQILVNGAQVAESSTFGAALGEDATIWTFSVTGIMQPGNVTLEVRNPSGGQITIDDVIWAGYPGN